MTNSNPAEQVPAPDSRGTPSKRALRLCCVAGCFNPKASPGSRRCRQHQTERHQVERINRLLGRQARRLRITTARWQSSLGAYHIVDLQTNRVEACFIDDLGALERELRGEVAP